MSPTPPGGRPSAAVYRRRRLVALLLVVAVIAAVVLVITNLSRGGSDTADPAATPSADAGADGGSGDAATEADPTPTASASGTETNADGSCAAGQLTVTPLTDAASYKAGALPKLSFTVVNIGTEPCTANLGTTTQVFTISSGSDVYWKSTDCQTGAEDADVELAPRTPQTSSPFEWSRVKSSTTTCESSERPAVPGGGATYVLSVEVAGVKSTAPKSFLLY